MIGAVVMQEATLLPEVPFQVDSLHGRLELGVRMSQLLNELLARVVERTGGIAGVLERFRNGFSLRYKLRVQGRSNDKTTFLGDFER